MKRLLFVISNFNIGGPQKSLLALLDNIDYSVFDVDILIMQPNGSLVEFINQNAKVIEASKLVTAFTLPSENIFSWLRTILIQCGITAFGSAIKELIKGKSKRYENISVSRQHFWYKNHKHIKQLKAKYDAAFGILGLSTYFIVDCVDAERKYHWIRSDTRILHHDVNIDSYYFKKCTGFLSVSNDCAKIFEDMYAFSKGRIRTFYNYIPEKFYSSLPVDTARMQECNAKTKILTICRLDPFKGLEMAIDACKILKGKGFDICWFVLGDGKYRTEVERMIEENNLKGCFILLGFQYNTLAFINEADILVHPSRSEGKSNAVDEALFCCKPTIVTNYATATEVIDSGVNGVICNMNGESIADSIEKVISDNGFRDSLISACRIEKSAVNPNEVLRQLC